MIHLTHGHIYQHGEELKPGDRIHSRVRPQDDIDEVIWVGDWKGRTRELGMRSLSSGVEYRAQQSRPASEGGKTTHRDDFLAYWVVPASAVKAKGRAA